MTTSTQWQTEAMTPVSGRLHRRVTFDVVDDSHTPVSLESFLSVLAFCKRDYMHLSAPISWQPGSVIFLLSSPARQVDALAGFEHYTEDDWDGQGASRIQDATIEVARRIISGLLPPLQKPEIAPGADGSIGMEWVWDLNGTKAKVFIDVGPGQQAVIYYRLPTGERSERQFAEVNDDVLNYMHHVFERVESAVSFD